MFRFPKPKPKKVDIIIGLLKIILRNQESNMAQIDDLNAAITTLQGTETTLAGLVQTIITDLQAAEQNQGVDLSGPIASLNAINTALGDLNTSLTAAETPTPPTA